MPVCLLGNSVLKQVSEAVLEFTDNETFLVRGMLATVTPEKGLGLAAPQVGILKRIILIRDDSDGKSGYVLMVNPDFHPIGTERIRDIEGCLSIPGFTSSIERWKNIAVRYETRSGTRIELEASGYSAATIQHEIDHLDGKLITDSLSRQQRRFAERTVEKYKEKFPKANWR